MLTSGDLRLPSGAPLSVMTLEEGTYSLEIRSRDSLDKGARGK